MRRAGPSPHARGESAVRATAVESGRRSGFEVRVLDRLSAAGIAFEYEAIKLAYTVAHTYTPDLRLRTRSGRTIFVELTGYTPSEKRTKLLLVRAHNPEVDLRIVFQRASNPINKGSKTTYGKWATTAGFKWAEGDVPQEWLDE